jgi:sulfur carrier protein ThiS
MNVTIQPIGPLRKHLEEGTNTAVVSVPDGSTVIDALAAIGISENVQWNASVNGQLVYRDTAISDQDHLLVFTPIEGG